MNTITQCPECGLYFDYGLVCENPRCLRLTIQKLSLKVKELEERYSIPLPPVQEESSEKTKHKMDNISCPKCRAAAIYTTAGVVCYACGSRDYEKYDFYEGFTCIARQLDQSRIRITKLEDENRRLLELLSPRSGYDPDAKELRDNINDGMDSMNAASKMEQLR